MWGIDHAPVQGAVYSLLEAHYNVDVLDEWALAGRLEEFPAVVAPEQDRMSEEMVERLQAYVKSGGKLLLSGAAGLERFGARFLGVRAGTRQEKQTYHVPAADGSLPIYSEEWQLLRPGRAKGLGRLGQSCLLDERLLPHPAATLHQVGQGAVAYIPFGLFRFFDKNRYPLAQAFAAEVMAELVGRLPIRVQAPTCVDAVLRRKGKRLLVHLINRVSGIPNRPNDGSVDEIPAVGPARIEVVLEKRPGKVQLVFEKGKLRWGWSAGLLTAQLEQVHIHAAVVVE
jgi:hypothetical protein